MIFTSNSHLRDDGFNIYMANVQKWFKDNFRTAWRIFRIWTIRYREDHENSVANYYLSWSQKKFSNKQHIPVGQLIDTNKNINSLYKKIARSS